jgi:hypothetical protein
MPEKAVDNAITGMIGTVARYAGGKKRSRMLIPKSERPKEAKKRDAAYQRKTSWKIRGASPFLAIENIAGNQARENGEITREDRTPPRL